MSAQGTVQDPRTVQSSEPVSTALGACMRVPRREPGPTGQVVSSTPILKLEEEEEGGDRAHPMGDKCLAGPVPWPLCP